MAEDTEGFPGAQVGTFIMGDHFVFRGNDGKELAEVVKSWADNAEDIMTAINSVKQAVVAKAIITGDSSNGTTKTNTRTSRGSGSRAKDDSPPDDGADITYFEEDGVAYASVKCKHGHMLDLRDKGYKADLYCSLDTKDWKKKCKPVTV